MTGLWRNTTGIEILSFAHGNENGSRAHDKPERATSKRKLTSKCRTEINLHLIVLPDQSFVAFIATLE
jgi:hypothetical protein